MSFALGIAALLFSLFSIFIPVFGVWLTAFAAVLAAFSSGRGFPFGLAAIIINLCNLIFLSPTMWLMFPVALFLVTLQVVALVLLVIFHNKKKAAGAAVSQPVV